MIRSLLVSALLVWLSGACLADDKWHVGFRELTYEDATRARAIPVALWYPSATPSGAFTYGQVHQGRAAPDAALAPGRHPLLLLSHGTGGNRFNQYFLGEFLARQGYVVAAVEHPGDRTFDRGDFGTAKNLFNRPRDISVVLDALLADAAVAPSINADRIGALGHSAGGFAAVVVAGARPKLANLLAYCGTHAEDLLTCPEANGARPEETPEHFAYIQGGVSLKDARIRAAAVFAPAIGPFFDAAGLAAVDIPIMVFWAGQDEILNEPTNSAFYLSGLSNAIERQMPSIGHFGFLSLCSDLLRSVAPEICVDPEGTSRAASHEKLLTALRAFLERHLPRQGG